MAAGLVGPRCGTSHPAAERFCRDCGTPLVMPGAPEARLSDRQQRARKVSPQYAEGRLTKVGWARNQAEAELIAGLLLEEGIPSVVRRSRGFDVPDFLAAGPRDILVAESGADAARDVLGSVDAVRTGPLPSLLEERRSPAWVRLLAAVLVAVTLGLVAAGVIAALV